MAALVVKDVLAVLARPRAAMAHAVTAAVRTKAESLRASRADRLTTR